MLVTPSGIVTLVRLEQEGKAYFGIDSVQPNSMLYPPPAGPTVFNPGQDSKLPPWTCVPSSFMYLPISVTLAGIVTLDFDLSAGIEFGRILAELRKKGKSKDNQDRDKMIAGHARSLGYILVTDNLKDFTDIDGLRIVNWHNG